jgi:multidrug efflux pump subunit AcrA (membrane-fusion protein)
MPARLPLLRKDLEIAARHVRGQPLRYVLLDPRTSKSFELGEREEFLCRQLDGETAPEEVLREYTNRFGEDLPRVQLDSFVAQLGGEGFLAGTPERTRTFPEIFDPEEFLPSGRVRLLRGDGTIDWLSRHLGWLFSLPVKVVTTAAILLGVSILLANFWNIYDAVTSLWGPGFLLTMVLLSIVFVHTPRALLQGMRCKASGGYVSEIGLMFLYYVVPEPYCRYSDLDWLKEKSKYLSALATGVYYQVLIWAVAIIGWFIAPHASLAKVLFLALFVGSGLGLLLVVINPLVKLDGYQMLVAWLEIPRLRERALAAFGSWVGRRPPPEPLTAREKRWFLVFGVLVFIFAIGHLALILVLAGMSLTESYQAAGFVATAGLALYMVQRPVGRFLTGLKPVRWLLDRLGHWKWRIGVSLAILIVLLLPYPYQTGGPFVVLPGTRRDVHCEIDGGRVSEVHVREGDVVAEGQPLAQIDRREYEKNLHVTQASLDDTEAKLAFGRKQLAMLDNPPDDETIRALEAEVRRLQTLVADYEKELELTTLRAPIAGRVVTPMIDQAIGFYLRKGDLFATIEHGEMVLIEIRVPEEDAPMVKIGARVKVGAWAYPDETFYGTVKEIAPIAATPVVSPTVERFNAVRVVAELPNPEQRFKTQITGFAKIKTELVPVWLVFTRPVIRWFQVQFWYWIP